jgi:hypothetical protein
MIEITNEQNSFTIIVGQYLFEFKDFDEWVNTATKKFSQVGLLEKTFYHICVDAKGRVCLSGREFQRARDDNSFPIKVYINRI